MTRVLVTLAALDLAVCGLLALAVCIVRARDNAKVRAARKARVTFSSEALDLALMRREFDAIVTASYARKDHGA